MLTETLINFRDFGAGHRVAGRSLRTGMLFRSGQTEAAGEDVARRLGSIFFDVIVDLRYPAERAAQPFGWSAEQAARILAHDGARDEEAPHNRMAREGLRTPQAMRDRYEVFYAHLPHDPHYHALFAQALIAIADVDGPVLIHCTAGKDRTGILAGLLLHMLGVDAAAIEQDYLRSADVRHNARLRRQLGRRAEIDGTTPLDEDMLDAVLSVEPRYLRACFAHIDATYGSVAAYLDANGCGADAVHRLRERLLEP